MNEQIMNNFKRSLTPSAFAALPVAFSEYIVYGGTVIARIHPNCNVHFDGERVDTDVIARALVYMPDDEIKQPYGMTGLRKLTITERNLEFDPEDISDYLSGVADAHMLPQWRQTRNNHWRCVEQIMAADVVDLSDPLRSLGGSA